MTFSSIAKYCYVVFFISTLLLLLNQIKTIIEAFNWRNTKQNSTSETKRRNQFFLAATLKAKMSGFFWKK